MKSATPRKSGFWRRVASVMRWCLRLLLVLIILDVAYLASIWPDWESYRQGPIQRSSFIRDYEHEQRIDRPTSGVLEPIDLPCRGAQGLMLLATLTVAIACRRALLQPDRRELLM